MYINILIGMIIDYISFIIKLISTECQIFKTSHKNNLMILQTSDLYFVAKMNNNKDNDNNNNSDNINKSSGKESLCEIFVLGEDVTVYKY